MAKIYQHLTTQERAVVMTMRADLCSIRSIAKRLCRSASTISRELKRTSGAGVYDADLAHAQCQVRRVLPRRLPKLRADGALFQIVRHQLKLLWSPQQIARKLEALWPDNPEKSVSHETAYSNERLVGVRDGEVLFRVRERDHPGKKRIERLPVDTFISRFLSHVLPSGFKRIRHYGLLANCHKREQLALCRSALDMPTPDPAVIESVDAFMRRVAGIDVTRCTCCAHGTFRFMEAIAPARHVHKARGPPP